MMNFATIARTVCAVLRAARHRMLGNPRSALSVSHRLPGAALALLVWGLRAAGILYVTVLQASGAARIQMAAACQGCSVAPALSLRPRSSR